MARSREETRSDCREAQKVFAEVQFPYVFIAIVSRLLATRDWASAGSRREWEEEFGGNLMQWTLAGR